MIVVLMAGGEQNLAYCSGEAQLELGTVTRTLPSRALKPNYWANLSDNEDENQNFILVRCTQSVCLDIKSRARGGHFGILLLLYYLLMYGSFC